MFIQRKNLAVARLAAVMAFLPLSARWAASDGALPVTLVVNAGCADEGDPCNEDPWNFCFDLQAFEAREHYKCSPTSDGGCN